MRLNLIFLSLALFLSCQENPKDSEKYAQMERILAIHDEVMPEMGTISGLISQIEPMYAADSSKVSYAKATEQLKQANGAMMQWMMDFSEDFTTDEIMGKTKIDQAKQADLDRYEDSANRLKNQMHSAINNAENLLKS
jgi:hypothetical protein